MPKRTRADRRRAALAGWRTRRANKRSAAAKRGWQTRRKNQRVREAGFKKERKRVTRLTPAPAPAKKKRAGKPVKRGRKPVKAPAPTTREYFVVVLFETRKHGKNFQRRLPEAILTLRDGATTDEIKEAYANWLLQNTKWKAQDIHVLIWSSNQGRRVEHKIVPRDSPGSSEPAGTVRLNDTRQKWGPDGKERKGKARRGTRGKKA